MVKLEKIVLELKEIKTKNEFLLDIAKKHLKYSIECKDRIRDSLYEIRQSYNYFLNLYKKAIWKNPQLAYNRIKY